MIFQTRFSQQYFVYLTHSEMDYYFPILHYTRCIHIYGAHTLFLGFFKDSIKSMAIREWYERLYSTVN